MATLENDTQNYVAAVTTNPVRMPKLRIAVANPDATVTVYGVKVVVELEFDALLYERLTQAGS